MARMEPEKLVALQRAVVLRSMPHGLMARGETCGYVSSRNPELCNCRSANDVDDLIELAKKVMVDTHPGRA